MRRIFESRLKKALWRIAGTLLPKAPRVNPANFPWNTINSVLVIRPDRMGDLILSTPVYESLKLSYPHLQVHVLVNEAHSDIVAGNEFVDGIITFNKKKPFQTWKALSKTRFDVAIVLNRVFSATAAVLALLSGASYRAGYDHREGALAYNLSFKGKEEPQHEIENNLDLLRFLGVPAIKDIPRLYPSLEETSYVDALLKECRRFPDRPTLLLKPGGRLANMAWSTEKFRSLVNTLQESRRANVFIICGPGEKDWLKGQFPQTGEAGSAILPLMSPKALAYLMSRSDLLVTSQAGIMHMASAMGTPVVVVFKYDSVERWRPCHTRYKVLEERDGQNVTPEQVLYSIDTILAETFS